ncbi:MAG: hypothetical protein K0S32_1909 [Bacteroidetes bacterium]|jgi:hypothetical protein|nr:hypothetical protein [Bacteroidota bacterium]
MGVLTLKSKYGVLQGAIGGIVGGVALALTSMLGSLILGKGLLHPIILAGYVFQPYVSDPEMSNTVLLTAIAVHVIASVLGGLLFIFAANTFLNGRNMWLWGMVVAGIYWLFAVLGGIQTVDPTMAAHMNHIGLFLGYMAYGAAMGAYVGRTHHHHEVKH